MNPEAITRLLTSRVLGRPVQCFQEVTSTNDLVLELARAGAPEGHVIFAETQTKGRGRLGRPWVSQSGMSLTFSFLIRPPWRDTSRFSLCAAVAIARVLQRFTRKNVGIKWPNDIYIDGKKVCGVLCESSNRAMVVGVGLNIFQKEEDFEPALTGKAGSLSMYSDETIDRVSLAASLLNELDAIYDTLPGAFDNLIAECESKSVLLGREVQVDMGSKQLSGRVVGMSTEGALQVRQLSGEKATIVSGEVTCLSHS